MSFTAYQNDYFSGQQLSSGEWSIPRLNIGGSLALVSGQIDLTFWTAAKSEVCNNIIGVVNSTAAGATPTFCGMAVYSADAFANLTLQAACANDTTLFAAAFTQYNRALTAPFFKQAGQRYAFAYLVVSAAAMPNMFGYNGTLVMPAISPRLSASLTGQVGFPASIPSGSLSGLGTMLFGAVTP